MQVFRSGNRVPEELWSKLPNTVQEAVTKNIPKKKKCNKNKRKEKEMQEGKVVV